MQASMDYVLSRYSARRIDNCIHWYMQVSLYLPLNQIMQLQTVLETLAVVWAATHCLHYLVIWA